MDIVQIVGDFGFPVVMVVGLGYFVYFVWQTITNIIDPAVQDMKTTIIRLTDQLRLLDQDMIRLQEKVNTVLELRELPLCDCDLAGIIADLLPLPLLETF